MTRQSAEIIAREMGGTTVIVAVTSGERDYGVQIGLSTGGRVLISDDKVELLNGKLLEKRIYLKTQPFA